MTNQYNCAVEVCTFMQPFTLDALYPAIALGLGVFVIVLLAGNLKAMWG